MYFKDINSGYYPVSIQGLSVSLFDEVLKTAADNGIVQSAVHNCNTAARGIRRSNQITLEQCEKRRCVPVFHLLPPAYEGESYGKDELERLIADHGVIFRAQPKKDACPFTDWMYDWMFGVLADTKTPLIVPLREIDLNEAAKVKSDYPDLPLILTNTTQWMNRQYIRFAKMFQNVFIDTSDVIEYYGIENIAGLLGAETILFGTSMPDKEPYDKIFQLLYCELSQEEKELIAYGNFDRLLRQKSGAQSGVTL